ncbi:glycosyltransferase family 2 protein [Alicyclobacillus dauci]|uniref:Glycosyltransferase family 2 protein n=1 Tax=Alicyclobacillus dauci TaxID=1475485 RepID=A0ABY6Z1H9_9BACL|nr:glycosyltransferase family 2 protein [Alicyclobacillus dauci]WAH36739.1 glycosyltransferase family 2 protein [Alicyclobacillus dauci]
MERLLKFDDQLNEIKSNIVNGRLAQSRELCVSLLSHAPYLSQAWAYLGETLEKLGYPSEAWHAYDRCSVLDPRAPWIDAVRQRLQVHHQSAIPPWLRDLLAVPEVSVAAAIIVKDGARTIKGVIEALKGAVDEIVIVDTGSTDKTVKIAKKLGAQVYDFAWNDDFSAARNYAMSKVRADWVLWVDADEVLWQDDIFVPKVIAGLYNPFDPPFLFRVIIANHLGDRTEMSYDITRFFPIRFGLKWWGRIHEQIGGNEQRPVDNPYSLLLEAFASQTRATKPRCYLRN